MDNNTLKEKGISAVIWNISGTLMKQGVTFIVSIFLARLLSPEDYGLVGMAMVFVTFTQSFADFGMTYGLVRQKNCSETQYSTVFYLNLIISIILMITMILLSDKIAHYYNNEEVGKIARFVSYSFIIYAINSVQQAQLTKQLANKVKTQAILISSVASGIVGIILALLDYKAWSLVYSSFVGSILSTFFIWSKSKWRPKLLFSISEIKPLLGLSLNMFSMGLINNLYEKIDVLIIGKIFSPATLGLFYKAKSFNLLITKYSANSLVGVLFPVFSKLQDNIEYAKNVATKIMHINLFLTFGLMSFLYVGAEDIIVLIFSDKWIGCVDYFRILIFSSYANLTRVILFNLLNGLGYTKDTLYLEILTKILGFASIGIGFYWGIIGYLWAMAICTFVIALMIYFTTYKLLKLDFWNQLRILFQYSFFCILSVVITYLIFSEIKYTGILRLLITGLFVEVVYVALNIVLKTAGMKYLKGILTEKKMRKQKL